MYHKHHRHGAAQQELFLCKLNPGKNTFKNVHRAVTALSRNNHGCIVSRIQKICLRYKIQGKIKKC